jgi:hypothetical protein
MAAAMLGVSLPLVPEAALGSALYLLVLYLIERRLFPDDFALARSLLARR